MERKCGGNFHHKLNMCSSPIANKYHEGKVKRTLKRVLKVPELAGNKANGASELEQGCCVLQKCCAAVAKFAEVWHFCLYAVLLAECVHCQCVAVDSALGVQGCIAVAFARGQTHPRTVAAVLEFTF